MRTEETTIMVRTENKYRVRLSIIKVIDDGLEYAVDDKNDVCVADVKFSVIREFQWRNMSSWVPSYNEVPKTRATFKAAKKLFDNLVANFKEE